MVLLALYKTVVFRQSGKFGIIPREFFNCGERTDLSVSAVVGAFVLAFAERCVQWKFDVDRLYGSGRPRTEGLSTCARSRAH